MPRLRVIAAGVRGDMGRIGRWAERLVFRETFGGRSVPAAVESIETLDRDRVDPKVRGFTELASARDLALVGIRVAASAPLPPTRPETVTLFDLGVDGSVFRERSVAVYDPSRRQLRLAFASDLHLASFWDAIDRAAERYDPEIAAAMVHPSRLLDRFIDEANTLANRGELDLVVLGGDLVEFVHNQSPGATCTASDTTNVHALAQALRRLAVPSFAIPGNHDYRAFPWRPRLYGLASIGIPASRAKSLLKQAHLWDRRPPSPADLIALRTADETGESALAEHLRVLAPATDFEENLHGTRLVFANTGRDVITQWRSVGRDRWGLWVRSLGHCWRCPDSEGFARRQVAQIAESLSTSRGAAVFFHAPLLNASHELPVELCIDRLDPGDGDDLASQVAFERRLRRGDMRHGVFFRNPGLFLGALLSASGSVATFSGHSHRAGAIAIDRLTHAVRSVPFGDRLAPEQSVTMLTAPALGQLSRNGSRPGYLLATFDDGRLVSVTMRTL